jgi:RNA polymerase sigma-70 factor (ECF subfamily)
MKREQTATTEDADSALIARFLKGDQSAFDALFLKYQEFVYNIVYGIIGLAEEARDVTQDVFLQVYRSLPSFRCRSRFATWLYRIAVNRALDSARAAKNRRWLPLKEAHKAVSRPAADPTTATSHHAEHDAVQRVLMEVPWQHRDVLVLRYFQELSLEEIAEVLQCSVTAVKVRLHRARRYFKEKYMQIYGQEEGVHGPLP